MFRTVPALIFLAFFFGFLAPLTGFCADSAYVVQNVEVDVLDQSAVKARNKAFADAQIKAFEMLSKRFWAEDEAKTHKPPTPEALGGMVQDFEIVNEQLSTKRYRGTYLFRFRKEATDRFFGHGPQYVGDASNEATKPHTLLIPYVLEGDTYSLWDKEKNPLLQKLKDLSKAEDSVRLPYGDISDVTDIPDKDPRTLTVALLKRIKARYDVNTVVVTVTHKDQEGLNLLVDIYKVNYGILNLLKTIEIGPLSADPVETSVLIDLAASRIHDTLESDMEAPPEPSPVVTPEVKEAPEVTAPQVSDVPLQSVQVRIFFADISQWLSVQQKLASIKALKEYKILNLRSNEAQMNWIYSNLSSLMSELAGKGMILQTEGPEKYILKNMPGQFSQD